MWAIPTHNCRAPTRATPASLSFPPRTALVMQAPRLHAYDPPPPPVPPPLPTSPLSCFCRTRPARPSHLQLLDLLVPAEELPLGAVQLGVCCLDAAQPCLGVLPLRAQICQPPAVVCEQVVRWLGRQARRRGRRGVHCVARRRLPARVGHNFKSGGRPSSRPGRGGASGRAGGRWGLGSEHATRARCAFARRRALCMGRAAAVCSSVPQCGYEESDP